MMFTSVSTLNFALRSHRHEDSFEFRWHDFEKFALFASSYYRSSNAPEDDATYR
jgi:hypothetical protein